MTHPHTFSTFLAGVAVAAVFLTDSSASAQRFRVTPLARLDFSANADGEGTLGINGEGQVVYGYKDSSGNTHAWLWLRQR